MMTSPRWIRRGATVLCLLLLPMKVQADEAAAFQALTRLGARAEYNIKRDDKQPGKPVIYIELSLQTKLPRLIDSDLKVLKEFKSLKWLDVGGHNITNAGLKEIKEIRTLEFLRLERTKITDVGLRELQQLDRLRVLLLPLTDVGDAGLKELKPLTKLEHLELEQTKVTDQGLKALKEFTSLKVLTLSDTSVSDTGIRELKRLKNLRELWLINTKVTPTGVKELQTALPKLKIHYKNYKNRKKGKVISALETSRNVLGVAQLPFDRRKRHEG